MDSVIDLLVPFMQSHPSIAAILAVIGALRLLMKPIFSLARAIADVTATPKDNEVLDKVEGSKYYAGFLYALDWFTSIKLKPNPKKEEQKAPEAK